MEDISQDAKLESKPPYLTLVAGFGILSIINLISTFNIGYMAVSISIFIDFPDSRSQLRFILVSCWVTLLLGGFGCISLLIIKKTLFMKYLKEHFASSSDKDKRKLENRLIVKVSSGFYSSHTQRVTNEVAKRSIVNKFVNDMKSNIVYPENHNTKINFMRSYSFFLTFSNRKVEISKNDTKILIKERTPNRRLGSSIMIRDTFSSMSRAKVKGIKP